MIVWRLTMQQDRDVAFDGKGAYEYGGRWNRQGVAVVYTAETLSLAILEQLVHVQPVQIKRPFYYFRAEIPDDSLVVMSPDVLPPGWDASPAPVELAEVGSAWAASSRSLALKVPSAVVPNEGNVILNPRHPAWSQIKVSEPRTYRFDGRLLKT